MASIVSNGLRRKSSAKESQSPAEEETSIQNATSVAEIRATLAKLKEQETSVTGRLNDLISSQKELSRELGKLDIVRAQLGSQAVATRSISNNMLSDAATTAKRISGAVQKLDLEQARVKATLHVVEQVSELKACVHGVVGSMGAPQDWETAAGYLNRASKIPKEIVEGSFAEEIVPSIEVPDPPSVTLEHASESLCSLFLREFEKATKEDNGAKIMRFFKLFPLIGRSDVGLNVYGRYVCQGVAAQARANLNAGTKGAAQNKEGLFYANALTKLFEYIAQIVDRHGGLVERHYGEGQMVKVIERLQMEADTQGGIVIDTWSEERSIDRKLTDIRSYAFTFLVQSFLPNQSSRNPISRTSSPAAFDHDTRQEDDDSVDMKEIDRFLGEMGVMLARWSVYTRFIATKCITPGALANESHTLAMPPLLVNSNLMRKVGDKLITPFNQMSTFYFRRSVEKAFQLDEQPQDLTLNMSKTLTASAPYITSAVDDVMYIVNQVLQRTLSTSQRSVIASVVPTISRILSADFIGMIQRKMRDESYPRPAIQGGLPPEHTIVAFLVLLNNLDVSTDYIKRIVSSRLDATLDGPSSTTTNTINGNTTDSTLRSPTTPAFPPAPPPSTHLQTAFPFSTDATFVSQSLHTLHTTFYSKTAELLADGIFVIFRNVMRPRLRPVLLDAFRDIDYSLPPSDVEELNRLAAEHSETGNFDPSSSSSRILQPLTDSSGRVLSVSDAVPLRFSVGWDALTRPLRRILTEQNWERLLGTTAGYLAAEVLEKRIWGYYGKVNGLGAVRLERDIAGIVSAVAKSGERYRLREAFERCKQICLVMNMEEEEWEEVMRGEGVEVEWKIDEGERRRARGLVKG